MPTTSPAWLAQRGGTVKLGSDGATWYVLLGDQPNYSLRSVPTEGKFGCVLRQTINGQRLPCDAVCPTEEDAISHGLADLGKYLGWA